jgi:hypothetical protein
MKFNIVGFPKCGTQSLEKFLSDKGHDVVRTELVYMDNGIEEHLQHYSQYRTVFITRDPEERMKSLYFFDHFHLEMSYEEFKKTTHTRGINFGVQTPETCCDYEKYIKQWSQFNPLVFKLENLKNLQGFPCINKNYERLVQIIT